MTENDLVEGKYIEVVYDEPTQVRLAAYCEENGFDCTQTWSGRRVEPEQFGFHTTLWWTTTKHGISNKSKSIQPFRVEPVGFDLFGPKRNILVMLVRGGDYIDRPMRDPEYDALLNLRNGFGNTYKMQDGWPDYKPHISLSYVHEGDIPDVPLPDFEMVADVMNIDSQRGGS